MADDWDRAVRKLIELTEAGSIRWETVPRLGGDRDRNLQQIGPAYVSTVNGRRIAVYEFQELSWVEELEKMMPGASKVAVEFVNEALEPIWKWPAPDFRWELLDSIRYQQADGNEFLKSFLADSPAP